MIDEKTALAIDACVRKIAKTEILPHFGNLTRDAIDEKSSAIDLVTLADQATEKALISALTDILPTARIIGEESIAEDPSLIDALDGQDPCVVIDPIDGTWNFAKGIAVFGVIIAIVKEGQTQFGLIHDPISEETIMARRGHGAWLCPVDGPARKIRVADNSADAPLFGIFGTEWMRHTAMPQLAKRFARVTAPGASAHDYRLLAKGHYHSAVCYGLNAWDHAAGQLIHAEAGGVSCLTDGSAYHPRLRKGTLILAHTDALLEQLVAEVREIEARP